MRPIVSFLSDFGLLDPYAGTVKAVMLGICPDLAIVDVTHEVAPQAVAQGAFLAQQAWPYFPTGAVHLAVVDPGVGTSRAAIALRTPAGYFVGPDNGLLSAALPDEARPSLHPQPLHATFHRPGGKEGNLVREDEERLRYLRHGDDDYQTTSNEPSPNPGRGLSEGREARGTPLPLGYEARLITNATIVHRDVSATFHGRDVFGPAAAHLAAGLPFEELGPPLSEMLILPPFRGVREAAATRGHVVHVDRFGNLITTVRRDDLPSGASEAEAGGRRAPIVRTYGESEGLVALIGSSGYLEVAAVNGNAARELGLGIGSPVVVHGR